MQAISTGLFSCALYWKRYTHRMRSEDETNLDLLTACWRRKNGPVCTCINVYVNI